MKQSSSDSGITNCRCCRWYKISFIITLYIVYRVIGVILKQMIMVSGVYIVVYGLLFQKIVITILVFFTESLVAYILRTVIPQLVS